MTGQVTNQEPMPINSKVRRLSQCSTLVHIRAMCQVKGEESFSAPWGSETPEAIHLKFDKFDYVHIPTPPAEHGGRCEGGVWSGLGKWVKLYPREIFHRQDAAKRQPAGIKFSHRPKIRFFAPQGRLVVSIHVKLGRAHGHVGRGSAWLYKISPQSPQGGGNAASKYQKFPLFGKESPLRGDSRN